MVQLALSGYGIADYPSGAAFGPRHSHNYEFVWMIQGDAHWDSSGDTYPAPVGSVFLTRPERIDTIHWDPDRRTRHGYVHFNILDRGTLPPEHAWPWVVDPGGENVLHPMLRSLLVLLARDDAVGKRLAPPMLVQILELFVHGAWQLAEDLTAIDEHPVLGRAMAWCQQRWRDGVLHAIGDHELAQAAGVSVGHLIRVFRAELQATPQQALRMLRLDRAATLLARSNEAVQTVSATCGFESPFHFSRRFKEAYGHSPRAFRLALASGRNRPTIPLVRMRRIALQLWQQV